MSRFKYKFRAIEDIKEKIKKNSEKEYAISKKIADAKRLEIDKLKTEQENSFIQREVLNVQEMVFLEKYRDSLAKRIEFKKKELVALENECDQKLKQLVDHHKDHKVFERLKEKHHEEYNKVQYKHEMKTIDEMANQQFNRKEK